MKINKDNAGWIFCCVVLAGLLLLSIFLGVSGWYFKNDTAYTTDFQLGKSVQISLLANQASATSLNLEGAFLPGEELFQVVSVKNIEDDKSVYVRAKATIDTSIGQGELQLKETTNWLYNENDGYYYLLTTLSAQNKVALCSHIYTSDRYNLQSGKKYIISFVFESLDVDQDVDTIWGINPVQNI